MRKGNDKRAAIQNADELAKLFGAFDYRVEADDFVLYELARLIEEDRASFEDEEFRHIIDEGIHEHIEQRLDIRVELAMRLRLLLSQLDPPTQRLAHRTLRALENVESPLHNASLIMRSYTSYLFDRLHHVADQSAELENEAGTLIERWRSAEIVREQLMARLQQIGLPAVGPLADILFDSPEDRPALEMALDTLASIHSSSSARVLAHAILEPILPEDLEMKTYQKTLMSWPLPRHYILHTLQSHTHEDLPFRWFQLLVESNELDAVDLILQEALVHAENTDYQEDLSTIIELLRLSRDPQVEEKLVALLNAPDTPRAAVKLLQEFTTNFRPSAEPADNPWSQRQRLLELNDQYLTVTHLLDAGKRQEAIRKLDDILKQEPTYPFAVALKQSLA